MDFTSQICTTHKQSMRLITLGLKKETADMGLAKDIPIAIENWKIQDTTLINFPAWSLHRLVEIMPNMLQNLYQLDFSKKVFITQIFPMVHIILSNVLQIEM